MTIDHIGLLFFPDVIALRIVGRLAFPLFAYLLVLGVKSTSNLRAYFNRMLFFALLSQVPYALVNGIQPWEKLNIYATLILGMILTYFIDKGNAALVLPLFASVVLPVDYGVYGTATVLLIFLMTKDWKVGSLIFVLINLILAVYGAWYQPFAILTLPLIFLHKAGKLNIKVDLLFRHRTFRKYFFYAYYPLHLTALYAIKLLL